MQGASPFLHTPSYNQCMGFISWGTLPGSRSLWGPHRVTDSLLGPILLTPLC